MKELKKEKRGRKASGKGEEEEDNRTQNQGSIKSPAGNLISRDKEDDYKQSIILKFGGSSIKTSEKIKKVYNIIKERKDKTKQIIVILSAIGETTEQLIKIIKKAKEKDKKYIEIIENIKENHIKIIKELYKNESEKTKEKRSYMEKKVEKKIEKMKNIIKNRGCERGGTFLQLSHIAPKGDISGCNDIRTSSTLKKKEEENQNKKIEDIILSYGEILSSKIIYNYIKLKEERLEGDEESSIKYINSKKLIKTNNYYNNAEVDLKESYKLIKEYIKEKKFKILIAPGFIGSDRENNITTIGRGGGDYTASIYCVGSEYNNIEIWTDVDGILTSDPRIIKNSKRIEHITYDQMYE